MNEKTQRLIEHGLTGVLVTISGVCLLTLASIAMGGCSTVAGFGQFVGGMGRDLNDAAEGARARMYEQGEHRPQSRQR